MIPLSPLRFLPVVAMMGVTGCGDASSDNQHVEEITQPTFAVRDSAGIEIVENDAPKHPDEFWTIDKEPTFVLGGDESDPNVGRMWRIAGVVGLVDGRIAVLSWENAQLSIFETSGELSRSMGRRGRGPGEFVRPFHLRYVQPDTLVVWDQWMRSVTRFDTTGALLSVRTIDLGRALGALPQGASSESVIVPLDNGSFIVRSRKQTENDWLDITTQHRPPDNTWFRSFPEEFTLLDTAYSARSLGTWSGDEAFALPKDIPGVSVTDEEWIAGSFGNFWWPQEHDSYLAAGGRPPRIYMSDGDKNEVLQFSAEGELRRIIRRTSARVAVSDAAHSAWRRHNVRKHELGREFLGPEFFESVPKRGSYPPVGGLSVDSEGYLWVWEWSESESGLKDRWSVFSPRGQWLGIVEGLPFELSCLGGRGGVGPPSCWIGSDIIVVVSYNDLGVETVSGYRLHR